MDSRVEERTVEVYTNRSQEYRIRLLQIAGVSLITLFILNAIFLPSVNWMVNSLIAMTAIVQFWLSFRLWNFYKKRFHQRMLAYRQA